MSRILRLSIKNRRALSIFTFSLSARAERCNALPSSHTSLVTTLTTGVAVYQGVHSPLFGISLIFSLYFIFEATGLRQEVGNQARVLNEIIDKVRETHHINSEELQELIGHTWAEVTGGFIVGLIVALIMY